MKKIFLFFISGLLVLLFSGSAMASGYITLGLDPSDDGNYYIPSDTGALDVPFTVNGLSAGTYIVEFTVSGPGLSGEVQDFSGLTGSSSGGATWTSTFTYSGDNTGNIHLVRDSTVPAGEGEVQIVIKKGTSTAASKGFAAAWLDIGIPEFPTVALPIAAILGLVFIFGRKKEGL